MFILAEVVTICLCSNLWAAPPSKSQPVGTQLIQDTGNVKESVLKLMEQFCNNDQDHKTQRNAVCKIVSDIGVPALPYLADGITNDNDLIRMYSLDAISMIVNQRLKQVKSDSTLTQQEKQLFSCLFMRILEVSDDTNKDVRIRAIFSLGCFENQEAVSVLEKALSDNEPTMRYEALSSLRRLGHREYDYIKVMTGKEPKLADDFLQLLGNDDPGVQTKVAQKLKEFGASSIPGLLKMATGGTVFERIRAISILADMKAVEIVPYLSDNLMEATKDREKLSLQLVSFSALEKIGTAESFECLKKALGSSNPIIKLKSVKLFMDKEYVIPILNSLLNEDDVNVRFEAASILARQHVREAIPVLIDLMKHREVYWMADAVLQEVTGLDVGSYDRRWRFWWKENGDAFEFPSSGTGKKKRIFNNTDDYKWARTYNSKGSVKEDICYNIDGSLSHKWIYTYDEKGNKIEWINQKADGSLDYKLVFKHDDKGNVMNEARYEVDGSLSWEEMYIYDVNGKRIAMEKRKKDGSLIYKYTYTYDEKGILTREVRHYANGTEQIFEHRHGTKDNAVK